ncbi:zinc finger protein 93 isoform X1 [Synchiropus splendidus]|uniref:zinc finger protein 93 isoform X1 n=1 Tax=Synchiropus splendidus TaxID=270530 RepID=UPI00237E7DA4|nr:zinc finger protein 93 isoform X1 [Synchiropus splendidus]XP_053743311.1 zinc finger protein 93 isoform X1 [Synchiropus splendidus]
MELSGRQEKCWVCGETFGNIALLKTHYKSHINNNTCHICNVTLECQNSLSTHLVNVHSPPFCEHCHQSFADVWELNKHAETSSLFNNHSEEVIKADTPGRQWNDRARKHPDAEQTAASGVDYVVREDSQDGLPSKELLEGESDNDSDSSSTDHSSDSSKSLPSRKSRSTVFSNSFCKVCGKGPFKFVKLHRRHCTGAKVEHRCLLCNATFETSLALNEHYLPLYSCEICGQIFSHQTLYRHHKCPKRSGTGRVLFCSTVMPIACKICKCFFTSEAHLSNHITAAHSSLVRTKVCIIKGHSGHSDKSILLTSQQLPSTYSPAVKINNGGIDGNETNGKPFKNSRPSSSSSPFNGSRHLSAELPFKGVSSGKPAAANTSSNHLVSSVSQAAAAVPHTGRAPAILALFENYSKELALRQRLNMDWRLKPCYRCHLCCATVRQRSFLILHRYRHRGKRLHHCHCGRRFAQRLYLLRHCVQHAEAVDYICASCGKTFTGSKRLAKHLRCRKLLEDTKPNGYHKRRCEMSFTCDCGLTFLRPSAYIWHHIQKHMDTRHLRKRLK